MMGERGEGLTGTTIKDIWTKMRGVETAERVVRSRMGRGGGKGSKLYLNNNKKCLKKV